MRPSKKNNLYIQFLNGQGLGNQLWLYYTGLSIAKRNNLNLNIINLENFLGIDFIDLSYNNKISYIPDDIIILYEDQYYDKSLGMHVSIFDDKFLNISKDVLIYGNFQSEKYIIDSIRFNLISTDQNIYLHNFYKNFFQSDNVCVLNIRGGEYKRYKSLILPINYWENCIHYFNKLYKNLKFYIVTDDPVYAKSIFPNIEVISGIKESFFSLMFAKNIIVSNSSFSYFPLRFNQKNPLVIAPFNWARFENSHNRWASPCNCYYGWKWMRNDGFLYSYTDAKFYSDISAKYYETYYDKSIPITKNSNKFIMRLKKKLKNILRIFFPRVY